jgi:hypothetical protein
LMQQGTTSTFLQWHAIFIKSQLTRQPLGQQRRLSALVKSRPVFWKSASYLVLADHAAAFHHAATSYEGRGVP